MAESRSSKFAIMAVAGSAAAIVVALIVVPFLTSAAQQPEGEQRRIVALESKYDFRSGQTVTRIDYVSVGDMEPNSARWFLDPFGKTMEGKSTVGVIPKPGVTINGSEWFVWGDYEAFEAYTIIRLPELFGGGKADIASYRAFNMISITVHCVSGYWPQEGRWQIADPCSGDLHRPWDGVAIGGPAAAGLSGGGIIRTGLFSALPSLDLAVDSEGYIVAKRPERGYSENGMPGEGRRLSFEEMQSSGDRMLAAASEHAGYNLPFPSSLSGNYYLSELRLSDGSWLTGDWRDKGPGAIEAVYNQHPLRSSGESEEIVLTTYPLLEFPEMALNSPLTANGTIDPLASDLRREVEKLNNTTVNSLIHVYSVHSTDLSIEATTDVGILSVFLAPSQIESGGDQQVSGALIWATSPDGEVDQLVTIKAWPAVDMNKLAGISRSLQVK